MELITSYYRIATIAFICCFVVFAIVLISLIIWGSKRKRLYQKQIMQKKLEEQQLTIIGWKHEYYTAWFEYNSY